MVGTAHQYLIRVEQASKSQKDLFGDYGKNLDLTLSKSIVRPITRKEARKIILKYEWLGTMSNTTRHYGIFFDGVLGGVVCFGTSCTANFNCPKEFGIQNGELWFLARGACVHWTPIGSASRLISQALKLLKQDVPEVKVVLAYSDVDAGEIGTVYQATNWYYIGKGTRTTVNWFNPLTKRRFDERMLHNLKFKYGLNRTEVKKKLLSEGWEIQPKAIKHKYCFLLGSHKDIKEIKKHLNGKIQPYPKRDDKEDSSGGVQERTSSQLEE